MMDLIYEIPPYVWSSSIGFLVPWVLLSIFVDEDKKEYIEPPMVPKVVTTLSNGLQSNFTKEDIELLSNPQLIEMVSSWTMGRPCTVDGLTCTSLGVEITEEQAKYIQKEFYNRRGYRSHSDPSQMVSYIIPTQMELEK